MMKVIYAVLIFAAILVVGTVGSVDIDRIDLWTGFCQAMLGVTLWLLAGYRLEEVKDYGKR